MAQERNDQELTQKERVAKGWFFLGQAVECKQATVNKWWVVGLGLSRAELQQRYREKVE